MKSQPTPQSTSGDHDDASGGSARRRGFIFGRRDSGSDDARADDIVAALDQLAEQVEELGAEGAVTPVISDGDRIELAPPVGISQHVELPEPDGTPETIVAPPVTTAPAAAPVGDPGAATAADVVAVDTHRILAAVESEAARVRDRVQVELEAAATEAERIRTQAADQAASIRDRAQDQARVLLNEVEGIITDSQRTGHQILARAESDAKALRAEATEVLAAARDEARQVVEQARTEGEQILAEQRRVATLRAQDSLREQERLREQIARLEERRRQVLESLEPLVAQLAQMVPQPDGARHTHIQAVPDVDRGGA